MGTVIELRRRVPRWARALQVPARYKGAPGGRASGKSHFFAEEAVEAMVIDPSLRFVCIREVQRALKYSAKALVESKIEKLGVASCFDVLASEIRRKGGTGVMVFEGMQDHTAESIKSLEGFGRAWVEEAQSLSQKSLDMLLPTIREPGSEIWFSWNPDSPADPVDKFFRENKAPDAIKVHSTFRENPFCPAVMHAEAARLFALNPEAFEHIWDGAYFLGGKGRVYSSYSGKPYPVGNIDESVRDSGGPLLIGIDFNVNPMTAIIGEKAVDECLVHDALQILTSNTEELARELRTRYPNRKLIACPDPSGRQRKTSAPVGQTDFTILQAAKFDVRAPNAAPLIVDRVNNTNAMLRMVAADKTERRRVRIHPRATVLTDALANQVYKEHTSQPDKKSGFDHPCDAFGYLLWQEFNVLSQPWSQTRVAY